MPTQDERFDDIAEGQIARIVYAELGEIVARREATIIKTLIALYPHKLNHDLIVGAVGELAANRRLITELELKIRKGLGASQDEFKQEDLDNNG